MNDEETPRICKKREQLLKQYTEDINKIKNGLQELMSRVTPKTDLDGGYWEFISKATDKSLANPELYFYEEDKKTHKPIYKDFERSLPYQNPVMVGAREESIKVFFNDSGSYYIELRDMNNALLYTWTKFSQHPVDKSVNNSVDKS